MEKPPKHRKPNPDDDEFRHLIGLLTSQFRRNPKRERVMREMLIRRDVKHSQAVLDEMVKQEAVVK